MERQQDDAERDAGLPHDANEREVGGKSQRDPELIRTGQSQGREDDESSHVEDLSDDLDPDGDERRDDGPAHSHHD